MKGAAQAALGVFRQGLKANKRQLTKGVDVKEHGVVKWFNGAKGYGFIQRASGEDVFVHFSAIQETGYKTLNEGETVEFECQQGPKGLNAANVIRAA
jgi:cold shock protein